MRNLKYLNKNIYCIDNNLLFTDIEFNIDNDSKQSVFSYIENICKNYKKNKGESETDYIKDYILKYKDVAIENNLCYIFRNNKIFRSCYGLLTDDEKKKVFNDEGQLITNEQE